MFVSEDARGWVPGLLVAWEPRPDGCWGRVVLLRDGEAIELLVAARLLKPAHHTRATFAALRILIAAGATSVTH